jgi:hypothetical protein
MKTSIVLFLLSMAISLGTFAQVDKSDAQVPKESVSKSGFVKLTPDQWKKLQPDFEGQSDTKGTDCRLVNCKKVCIPGCDPPDENGTIRGCSSCYSWYYECELVCDK